MIVENSEIAPDGDDLPDNNSEPSKSQRKRDADAIRDLGQRLAELGPSELATVPLDDDVVSAIHELQRIKARGAHKRQLGFLAKKLRQQNVEAIDTAMEKLRLAAREKNRNHHMIEYWRDRLLGDIPADSAFAVHRSGAASSASSAGTDLPDDTADNRNTGSSRQALTDFLDAYPTADRQRLRSLQRRSIDERSASRPPAAARQLFRFIREVHDTSLAPEADPPATDEQTDDRSMNDL